MTKEQQQKAQETRAFYKRLCEQQTIQVDSKWRFVRLDDKCWQIQYLQPTPDHPEGVWSEKGFYGHVSHCVTALVDKMLDEDAKTSLASIYESITAIKKKLEEVFGPILPPPKL